MSDSKHDPRLDSDDPETRAEAYVERVRNAWRRDGDAEDAPAPSVDPLPPQPRRGRADGRVSREDADARARALGFVSEAARLDNKQSFERWIARNGARLERGER